MRCAAARPAGASARSAPCSAGMSPGPASGAKSPTPIIWFAATRLRRRSPTWPWTWPAVEPASSPGHRSSSSQPAITQPVLIVTTNDIPGYRITQVHGDVFGLIVRARNYFSNLGAQFRTLRRRRGRRIHQAAGRQPQPGPRAHVARSPGTRSQRCRRHALRLQRDRRHHVRSGRLRHSRDRRASSAHFSQHRAVGQHRRARTRLAADGRRHATGGAADESDEGDDRGRYSGEGGADVSPVPLHAARMAGVTCVFAAAWYFRVGRRGLVFVPVAPSRAGVGVRGVYP